MNSDARPLILVVDDDPSILRLVQTMLTRAGMDAVMADTAMKAAQALKSKPMPNLMILDMMLPDVSGIDFLRQMRAKEIFDPLPVLILSALADPQQIRDGLSAGADRYLTKPYLANNLVSTVNEMLKTGRVRK
ncbi:MAG TPA: response regulator [Phototrophicaceae bacterium]|nr:response regulator [Phototrophicaceae bacterium]